MTKHLWVLCMIFLVAFTTISYVYVIANNVSYKQLWTQKCKDGGGVTVTTPEGYLCINPSAIIEVN